MNEFALRLAIKEREQAIRKLVDLDYIEENLEEIKKTINDYQIASRTIDKLQ